MVSFVETKEVKMPLVTIDWWIGNTVEQKKQVAEGITSVIAKTLSIEPEAVHLIINDCPRENWAKGGKLSTDPDYSWEKS